RLIGLGYEENLAKDTAEAMVNGDMEKMLEGQRKHLESFEKKIREGALKSTPKPVGDAVGSSPMTLKDLRKLSSAERYEFSRQFPEQYKELYGGN
ncbi:MAG: hypothetical protein IK072_01890, partial [Clostridia bacterium]|nr:hypothetical protein [Clostridia bacterium]